MSQWQNQRRAEKRENWLEEAARAEDEQARLDARSMFEKIESAQDIHDLKPILHEIVEKLGL